MSDRFEINKVTVIDGEGVILGDFTYEELYKKYAEDTLPEDLHYWAPGMRMWMGLSMGLGILTGSDTFMCLEGDGDMVLYSEMPDKPVENGNSTACLHGPVASYEYASKLVRERLPYGATSVRFPVLNANSEDILYEEMYNNGIKVVGVASWVEFLTPSRKLVRDEWGVYLCDYGRRPLAFWIGSRDGNVSGIGSQSMIEEARQAEERGELVAFARKCVKSS